MKKRGETQGLHPSRDKGKGQVEYENLHGRGSDQIYLTGGGVYETSELQGAKDFWINEGALNSPEVYADARHILEPAQGRIFDPDKHEAANRQKLGRERFAVIGTEATELRNKALQQSTIPTSHLQSRPTRPEETHLKTGNEGGSWVGSGAAGWYRRGLDNRRDTIAVNPALPEASDTFIHEAGHRRHLGEVPYASDLVNGRNSVPDPLQEAVADAYEDRYAGPEGAQVRPMMKDIEEGKGKFGSYQHTGYSTDPDRAIGYGWNETDRAVYAATRAHASETGEQPYYEPRSRHVMEKPEMVALPRGNPTSDATIHSLISAGPHAAQALRQTGLKDVGAAAFRRHRDRQLLTQGQEVQGALFHQLRSVEETGSPQRKLGKVAGYVPNPDAMAGDSIQNVDRSYDDLTRQQEAHGGMLWPEHMSHNQFGEAPRTQREVQKSLGVKTEHAKSRGFT